ncbi:tripartite ATP-independent periplasmic transporter [Roseivivax marinus]|uniref:TRAP transporter small permease protein n=1 Tax=Roseivivax marinus TaxID=1379903 RepID=W4HH50_9RHOB|nr:TRAP transporter small permease [Roseivivax marinus]ETW12029.1 tripartite ATP-independent periplasmic transporter [Roseivivax marinus]
MGVVRGLLVPFGLWNDWALAAARVIALAALGAMVVVILTQVFFRYVLNDALPWPDEAARFLMLWMTGLAAPTAFRHGGFVAIDMVRTLLPATVAGVLNLILLAMSLTVLLVGAQLGWTHVNSGWLFNSSSLRLPLDLVGGEPVRIKLAWMYLSLFTEMVLLTVVNIELILREVLCLAGEAARLPSYARSDVPEAE